MKVIVFVICLGVFIGQIFLANNSWAKNEEEVFLDDVFWRLLYGPQDEKSRMEAFLMLKEKEVYNDVLVDFLIPFLNDPNWQVRDIVVEILGKIGDARAVEPLSKMIDDPSVSVRCKVIEALGKINSPEVVAPLISALNNEYGEVVFKAVEALKKISTPLAIEPLIKLFLEENIDSSIQKMIVENLSNYYEDERVIAAFSNYLKEPRDLGVVKKIIDSLSSVKDKSSLKSLVPVLMEILTMEKYRYSSNIRKSIITLLGEIGDTRAIETLLNILQNEKESKHYVLSALRNFHDPSMINPLIELLKQEEDRYDFKDILEILEGIEGFDFSALVNILIEIAEDTDRVSKIRELAIEYLGKAPTEESMNYLINIIENENEEYKITAAAQALGMLKHSEAVPVLIKALENNFESQWTKREIIEALGKIGDEQVWDVLVNIAKNKDEGKYTRRAALLALCRINPVRGFELVRDMDVRDREDLIDYGPAKEMTEIFLNSGATSQVVELFSNIITDKQMPYMLRSRVIKASLNISDPSLIEALIKVAKDTSERSWLREDAVDVLADIEIANPELAREMINLIWVLEYDYYKDLEPNIVKMGSLALEILEEEIKKLMTLREEDKISSRDYDLYIRRAVDILGKMKAPQAIKIFEEIINGPSFGYYDSRWSSPLNSIKYAVEKIVPQLIENNDTEKLIALLSNEELLEEESKISIIKYLGEVGGIEVIGLITPYIDYDFWDRNDSELSRAAVEVLRSIFNRLGEEEKNKVIDSLLYSEVNNRADLIIALGDIGAFSSVEKLMAIISDQEESYTIREAAVKAVGKLGDPQAVDLLLACLREKGFSPRYTVIKALGDIGDPRAISGLIPIIADPQEDTYVQKAAIEALGKIGDLHTADLLYSILTDKERDYRVRLAAAKALGDMKASQYVDTLIAYLTYPGNSSEVRRVMEEALGKIGEPKAVESLIETFKYRSPRWFEALTIFRALSQIGSSEAIQFLMPTLLEYEDISEAQRIELLDKIADERSTRYIIRALANEESRIREWAEEKLRQFGKSIPELLITSRLLLGSKEEILEAIEDLREAKEVKATEALLSLLGNIDEEIRGKALEALQEIKGALENEDLRNIVEDSIIVASLDTSFEDKVKAIERLSESQDIRVADVLIRSLASESVEVKFASMQGLVKLGESIIEVLRCYQDDPEVSEEVNFILSQLLERESDVQGSLPLVQDVSSDSECELSPVMDINDGLCFDELGVFQ